MLIKKIKTFDEFKILKSQYKNIIINVSFKKCIPCIEIKPKIEEFIINKNILDTIYLILDRDDYTEDSNFEELLQVTKFPHFSFIKNSINIYSITSSNFELVSENLNKLIQENCGNKLILLDDEDF
jgi:hypothetical protein